MRRVLSVTAPFSVLAAVLTASAASAQPCSKQLQDQWAAASLTMQRRIQLASRQLDMREQVDTTNICGAAKDAPAFLRTAKAYYKACDPIGGSHTIPSLEARLAGFMTTAKALCR